MSKKITTQITVERLRVLFGDVYDYSSVCYVDQNTPIKVACPNHGEFNIRPKVALKRRKLPVLCPVCIIEKVKEENSKSLSVFITQASEIHNNKYDYSKVEYTNNKTKVCIICPEHGEFWQTPHDHISGKGCQGCAMVKRSLFFSGGVSGFIERSRSIHGDKFDYSLVREYVNEDSMVSVVCREHGPFVVKASTHTRPKGRGGCPSCYSSYGESIIKQILEQREYDYKQNVTIDGCFYKKPLRFDFVIYDYCDDDVAIPVAVIEYDGVQHFEPTAFSKSINTDKALLLSKHRDNIKDKFCIEKGIRMLRIPYTFTKEETVRTLLSWLYTISIP